MNAAYGYHISRTGTWEALGLPDQKPVNHLVVCERCGQEFKRARASNLVQHPSATGADAGTAESEILERVFKSSGRPVHPAARQFADKR